MGNLRVNINLFKLLIMPYVKMSAINVTLGNSTDRMMLLREVRKWMKYFCILPKTTPNKIVKQLFGDVGIYLDQVLDTANKKLEERMHYKK